MNDKELAFEYIEDMANRRPEEEGDPAAPREYVHSAMTTHYTPESDKAVRPGADNHMKYPSLKAGIRVMQYKETT